MTEKEGDRLHAIIIDGQHIADVTFKGAIAQNPDHCEQIEISVRDVLQGRDPLPIALGLERYYANVGDGAIDLRFIDRTSPRVSEPMVTIVPQEGFADKCGDMFAQKLCTAFVMPENSEQKKNVGRSPKPMV